MKFKKEYQTYLVLIVAILTAGYFLKSFFFNKKNKVVEGNATDGDGDQYYRIALNLDNLNKLNTDSREDYDKIMLKTLILTQFKLTENIDNIITLDEFKIVVGIDDDTYDNTLNNDINDFFTKIINQSNVLVKDNDDKITGIKVKRTCGDMLDYFKQQADAAASNTSPDADADAALAAYDYADIILADKYNENVAIMALIAAGNLLALMGQPGMQYNNYVVLEAKEAAAKAAYYVANAEEAINTAANAVQAAGNAVGNAVTAANAAYYADEAAKVAKAAANPDGTYVQFYNKSIPMNDTYLKQVFINSAGQIYKNVYILIKNIEVST
jgi:hypothetical protein